MNEEENKKQVNNPLHGITLQKMVQSLVDYYGWSELGEYIDIRCFNHDPSMKSSLKFLRKNLWAREKVEKLYITTESDKQQFGNTKSKIVEIKVEAPKVVDESSTETDVPSTDETQIKYEIQEEASEVAEPIAEEEKCEIQEELPNEGQEAVVEKPRPKPFKFT